MAKKQVFGDDAQARKGTHRKMAKVIISTKLGNNKFAYKESMVDQDSVKEYINENKS
ncbi:MAG: DUF4295 domain-containing protein [Balneolaceae bacterium]|nr:DUF4295 domain-containing protein [Balneolaceae bacterium]